MQHQTKANLNVRSGPGLEYEIWDVLDEGDIVDEIPVEGWCPIGMEDGDIGWVSRKYLIKPIVEEVGKLPAIPTSEPVWIRWARSKLGLKEVPGVGDNPEIASWYRLTTLPEQYWHDATAWCAVFVNAGFVLNGVKTNRSAKAVDWLQFGKEVTIPQIGDVVIFRREDGGYHVAYFLKQIGEKISVIGGNQKDSVSIVLYSKSRVVGYRRAI